MATKVLLNQAPYQESKTIDLGSGTDFTVDLSQAQRFVVTLTGDAIMTLTQPVLMQDQEITLLVKCAVARTVTFPANCYNAAGALASFTFLPSGVVGAGGHALTGVVTSNGIFWDDGAVASGSIPDTALVSEIVKDPGAPGVATLGVFGPVANGETFTLGSTVYTFMAGPEVLDTDVFPGGVAPYAAAVAITRIVARVNAHPNNQFDALDLGAMGVSFVEHAVGGTPLATTEAMVAGAFGHTATVGARAATVTSRATGVYRVRANDVNAWVGGMEVTIGGIASTTQPRFIKVQLRNSWDLTVPVSYLSTATIVARVAQAGTNYWVLLIEDPGAVLSADDGILYEIEV
jgi:hypothetical protein